MYEATRQLVRQVRGHTVGADTFPAEAFVVEGEPEAVREVSRGYGRFAAVAAEAAAGLRGMDSGAWVGSEGDLFRLARTGLTAGAGDRLPQDMNLVKRIAAQAGVGLDGVKLRIHKSAPRQGMFGQTTPDGVLHLYPNAFRSEEPRGRLLRAVDGGPGGAGPGAARAGASGLPELWAAGAASPVHRRPEDRIGYGAIWCDHCHWGAYTGRAEIPPAADMLPFGVSDDVVRTRIPSFRETPHRLDDDVIEEFEGGPGEERAER